MQDRSKFPTQTVSGLWILMSINDARVIDTDFTGEGWQSGLRDAVIEIANEGSTTPLDDFAWDALHVVLDEDRLEYSITLNLVEWLDDSEEDSYASYRRDFAKLSDESLDELKRAIENLKAEATALELPIFFYTEMAAYEIGRAGFVDMQVI